MFHKGIVIKTNANQRPVACWDLGWLRAAKVFLQLCDARNGRYATTPLTAALFREERVALRGLQDIEYGLDVLDSQSHSTRMASGQVCKRCDVPVQDFVVRNDSPCGSTIGSVIVNQPV